VKDEATGVPAVMLGLPEFVVLAAGRVGGELELLIETGERSTGCPSCGVMAIPHGRREHLVRDVPAAGLPVLLVWRKRIWRCAEPACPRRTWSETTRAIRRRAALTERARIWACRRVGRDGHTVAGVAADLGVGWATVMRAVADVGTPLIEDPARLDGVSGLGVDEHVWQHPGPGRRTQLATGIVDLSPGRPPRLLDVVPGRTGRAYADWLAAQDPAWRRSIRVAALDPFRGYANALTCQLPNTLRVLDAFHVVRLGNQVVDEVRRRVQQATLGHRGYRDDPLYRIRRLLLRGAERLTDRQQARLDAALQTADPDGEVSLAWQAMQAVRAVYHADHPEQGRQRAEQTLAALPSCPIPEVARLGRTLRSWRAEFLGYFDTDGISNGPTEAMNLLIEKIRRVGHGYRNFANYRLRLLLHTGVTWHTGQTPRIRPRKPRLAA
jgi:transposase